MEYKCVEIKTLHLGIDILTALLIEKGISGFEIEDEKDFENFLEANEKYWDYVDEELRKNMAGKSNIKIYISDDEDGEKKFGLIKDIISGAKKEYEKDILGELEVKVYDIKESDWANNWKQYFHKIELGEKVVILPDWEKNDEVLEGKIIFKVDPGMTFGTGSHETTQLCIKAMEKYLKAGNCVLDLGCGSGILSIISLMLGAKSAVGVDIDENAVKVAYENAGRNNIDCENYKVYSGDIVKDKELGNKIGYEKYDLVLANIVADVIIQIAGFVFGFMKKGGFFITSGIISEREAEVKQALLESKFEILERQEEKGWVCFVCRA